MYVHGSAGRSDFLQRLYGAKTLPAAPTVGDAPHGVADICSIIQGIARLIPLSFTVVHLAVRLRPYRRANRVTCSS